MLIDLGKYYKEHFGDGVPEFVFIINEAQYVGTYCSVWFEKDYDHPLLQTANEHNCANKKLWGYKFIDFTFHDRAFPEEIRNRVFLMLRGLLGPDFEKHLYRYEKTVHIKQFFQCIINNGFAVANGRLHKLPDDLVRGKLCEIWCEANWNGNTGEWNFIPKNLNVAPEQYVRLGCPYYRQDLSFGISIRIVGARIGPPLPPLSSNYVHQFLAIDNPNKI